MEDVDEDVDGQGGSQSPRTAVLWEKCFQHSIFVDLSEDESLHFSDLESSFPLRLSQEAAASEASLHLSGYEELSALEDSSSSECSGASSKAEEEEDLMKARSNNSMKQRSPSRPRSLQGPPPSSQLHEDQGQNTSDEDQEDLPFDGVLGSPYFNQTSSTESCLSPDGRQTPQAIPESHGAGDGRDNRVAQNGSLMVLPIKEPEPSSHQPSGSGAKDQSRASRPASLASPGRSGPAPEAQPPDISRLLLRHFSREELCRSVKLIEAETLPEVSLLESVDDTRLSTALPDNPAGSPSEDSLSRGRPAGVNYTNQCSSGGNWDEAEDDGSVSAPETADGADRSVTEVLSSRRSDASDGTTSEHQSEGPCPTVNAAPVETDGVPLARARSCSELKYGQGQVHYPPPDFSKVAPKVKLPKAPAGAPSMPVAPPPSTMCRARSSPGVLGLVRRVLEDSDQAPERPYLFPDQETRPGPLMVDHLQAEYDKLLTKYAEAENLIDEMRLGNKLQTSSEDLLQLDGHFESLVPPLPPQAVRSSEEPVHQISTVQPSEQDPSDGERMTDELRDIIREFMKKVEEFKVNLNNSPMSLEDQQMMFRSMMEAQDQLERKYISNKEAHRTLEMQNYIGLCRNAGSFDPDRLAEGDIFRIGMHLEDIKEMIDRNACGQLAPPTSSSTPTSMPPPMTSPGVDPGRSHLSEPSDHSSQHEEQGAWFSASAHELWAAAEDEEEEQEASEEQGDSELNQSRESSPTHSWRHSSTPPQISLSPPPQSQGSPEGPDITAAAAAAADEEEPGVERSRLFLLASPGDRAPDPPAAHGTGPTSTQRPARWTHADSIFPQDSTLSTGSEWEVADNNSLAANHSLADYHRLAAGISLDANDSLAASSSLDANDSLAASDSLASSDSPAVGLSPSSHASETHSTSSSQRIVSPETDSGFGSSDWLQPGVGTPGSEPPTESAVCPPSDALSVSDSEDSSSPLQTAIHPPTATTPPGGRSLLPASQSGSSKPHLPTQTPGCGGAVDVDLWVESTTKERPIRHQGHLHQSRSSQVKQHLSEPALSTAMQALGGEERTHSCSCNSEALVALQAEMSQLKKDLEDGLVQLPRLAQKMDYLSSKVKLDRHHRPPRTRLRARPGKDCSSVIQLVGSRSEVWGDGGRPRSRPLNGEDWTSSDLELSRSKDSGKPEDSTVTQQFQDAPAGGDRGSSGSLYLCSELPLAPQSNRHACRGKEVRTVPSKERCFLLSPPPLQKPLLQVNYASSCSLPASYKVKEPPAASDHQRRSVQSDSALLPSNVFFQRTPSPAWEQLKTGRGAARRRGSKEEEMNRTLDRAIEAAHSMKRTTEHMAKSLTADLARAQLRGKLQHAQPLGGGRGSTL